MSIGKNIRYLRKKAGLTQKQLAGKVGVNEVTIRSYEAEKYEPKTETLYKLVRALDCNVNEILDKPFDLLLEDSIFISTDNLDELTQKTEERTGRKFEKDKAPSYFSVPAEIEFMKKVNIDRNNPLNIALKKLNDDKPLTAEESQLIEEYANSDIFRKNLAELPMRFKKLADSIRKSYSLLNAEGKEEAVKQVELADRQIELLTEIPKYRKPDNEE